MREENAEKCHYLKKNKSTGIRVRKRDFDDKYLMTVFQWRVL